jgi:hypothetical protein
MTTMTPSSSTRPSDPCLVSYDDLHWRLVFWRDGVLSQTITVCLHGQAAGSR